MYLLSVYVDKTRLKNVSVYNLPVDCMFDFAVVYGFKIKSSVKEVNSSSGQFLFPENPSLLCFFGFSFIMFTGTPLFCKLYI